MSASRFASGPAARLAVALLLCVAHGAFANDARADTLVAEQVVARVNGRPILLSEIRARARPRLASVVAGDVMARVTETQKAYAEVLEQRIEEEVVVSIAAPLHLAVSESEVEVGMAGVAKQIGTDREGLLTAAALQGVTEAEYRVEIRSALLRQKVIHTLGLRDMTQPYPLDDAGRRAWLARAEVGPFAAEKKRACVERWVRW